MVAFTPNGGGQSIVLGQLGYLPGRLNGVDNSGAYKSCCRLPLRNIGIYVESVRIVALMNAAMMSMRIVSTS